LGIDDTRRGLSGERELKPADDVSVFDLESAQQIRLRFRSEADLESVHAAALAPVRPVRPLRALSKRRASLPSTVAAETYLPDFLAALPEASPRSMKAPDALVAKVRERAAREVRVGDRS
jgi:hypothetical protein